MKCKEDKNKKKSRSQQEKGEILGSYSSTAGCCVLAHKGRSGGPIVRQRPTSLYQVFYIYHLPR